MAIIPKRTKYRKQQKGRIHGKARRGTEVTYGEFGLVATTTGKLTQNQIEAARIAMTRYIKRGGKVWIKLLADKPITKKPAETRMGKGKGAPEYWVSIVKPGKVMFEMAGVSEKIARRAFELASYKLPVKTKFVMKKLTAEEKEEIQHALENEANAAEAEALEEAASNEENVENAEENITETKEGGDVNEN